MGKSYFMIAVLAGAAFILPQSAFADSGEARVRVLHASPDAPAVDVLVDDVVAIEDLSFGNVTSYVSLPTGTYSVKVRPANSTEPDVISTSLSLVGGRDYTIAAVNPLASIEAQVYQDRNFLGRDDKSKLRAIHLSPGAPAVDVALKGGPVILSNLSYKNASEYLRLDPGTYDLEIRVAGTDTVVLDIPGVILDASKVYQVYAVGLVGGSPEFGVRLSVDDAINLREAARRRFDTRIDRLESRDERLRERWRERKERLQERKEQLVERWESCWR